MFVKAVNHQIYIPKIPLLTSNDKHTSGRSQKNNNSNVLMQQLSFMGLRAPVKTDLSFLPQSYRENLIPFKFQGCTILGKKSSRPNIFYSELMILDTPLKFADAISELSHYIDNFGLNPRPIPADTDILIKHDDAMELGFYQTDFSLFKRGIEQASDLKNIYIKGIVGQGSKSTCFLTDDNTVLKLARLRNFLRESEFIEGVDIPVIKGYVIDTPPKLFAAHVPFAEEASIKDISEKDFLKIREIFYKKMKQANRDYNFYDFYEGLPFRMQVGYVNNKPYLLDPECITGRIVEY